MDKKHATLRDVAAATGYSINTVSRAMKDLPIVAGDTRREIQAAARRMGYRPNRAAQSLRSGQTRMLAFIGGHILNPFFAMLFEYVRLAAAEQGYTAMLFSANENEDDELKAIRTAVTFGVDGIVLIPCCHSDACIRLLGESGLPFVLLARRFPQHDVDSVVWDEEQYGHDAGRYLLDRGCESVLYVNNHQRVYSIDLRKEGFLRAMREAGVPEDRVHLLEPADGDPEPIARRISALCHSRGVTGVAVFCDVWLRAIVANLAKIEPALLDTLSLIGFDRLDSVLPDSRAIPSLGPDYRVPCREAVERLIRKLSGAS